MFKFRPAVLIVFLILTSSTFAEPTRIRDVIYARKFGTALTMDVIKPEKQSGIAVAVMVSGGFTSSHEMADGLAAGNWFNSLLERGQTVFLVVHGSQPKYVVAEINQDIQRAIRFIRSNAAEYGIDPQRIGITGGSSGGYLSVMAGVSGRDGDKNAKDSIDRASSQVQAVGCFFPPTDLVNYGQEGRLFNQFEPVKFAWHTIPVAEKPRDEQVRILTELSPIYHISKNTAPTFIITGDTDALVPHEQSMRFIAKLEENKVPCKIDIRKGLGHGWPTMAKDYELIAQWFDEQMPGKTAKAGEARAVVTVSQQVEAQGQRPLALVQVPDAGAQRQQANDAREARPAGAAAKQAEQGTARTNAPATRPVARNFVSPEVLPDHRVTIRINAPKASDVSIGGDFGAGGKLTKDETGLWSITIGPLTPDLYSYTLSVDGVKTLDPRNVNLKVGVTSLDNTFFVEGAESKFEMNAQVAHGQVREVWYQSKTLESQRRMHVYTPSGYDASPGERYPVLYLLHGAGDEDSGWSTIGRAGFILDNLIAEGKAKPMVIVMPNGSLPRPANFPGGGAAGGGGPGATLTPQQRAAREGFQDRFTNELMKEIIPTVEKNFRVVADPQSRALAGLSMGGGQTLRVATQYPDQFGYFAVWSMGIGNNAANWETQNEKFLGSAEQLNKSIKLFTINVGDKDFTLAGAKALDEVLSKHGIKHEFHTSGGGHTWINWRHYLNETAPKLFQ